MAQSFDELEIARDERVFHVGSIAHNLVPVVSRGTRADIQAALEELLDRPGVSLQDVRAALDMLEHAARKEDGQMDFLGKLGLLEVLLTEEEKCARV